MEITVQTSAQKIVNSASGGSLHVIGSRQLGGADQFYIRLIQSLHSTGERVIAVNRPNSPIASALAPEIEQVHLPLANKWDAWSAWRLRRLVRRLEPQVVQTYMGRASRLTRLGDFRDVVHLARLGGYYKLPGYFLHADGWIGNTRGVCDYLLASGLPANRIHCVGNFVPEPKVYDELSDRTLRSRWQIPDGSRVVFSLGRLICKKGYQDLLAAFAQMPAEVQSCPVVLVIAGAGDQREPLQQLAKQLKVDARVRWIGWCDAPGDWFHLSDLFVCPSRHETLGNVILEAWSYKRPVLSTASLGATELIEDTVSGYLTPCEDPSAMANSMLDLLRVDPPVLAELGRNGFAELQRGHSQDAVVAAYRDLYATVTKR